MMALEVLAEADEEIEEARRRYWSRSDPLGGRFDVALDQAIEFVRSRPEAVPKHSSVSERHDVRFVTLGRFPFLVIYQVRIDALIVVALAHHRRRPGYWKSRLRAPRGD